MLKADAPAAELNESHFHHIQLFANIELDSERDTTTGNEAGRYGGNLTRAIYFGHFLRLAWLSNSSEVHYWNFLCCGPVCLLTEIQISISIRKASTANNSKMI